MVDSPIEFSDNETAKNIIDLIKGHRPNLEPGNLFLDFGCGYGQIAELVRDSLGLTYIGIDSNDDCLISLEARGFETHWLLPELSTTQLVVEIRKLKQYRPISVLLIGDGMSGVRNFPRFLKVLSDLAWDEDCPIVVNFENSTRSNFSFPLASGVVIEDRDFELGSNEFSFGAKRSISQASLEQLLFGVGLSVDSRGDKRLGSAGSFSSHLQEQAVPGSPVKELLSNLRAQDTSLVTERFIWLCMPGEHWRKGEISQARGGSQLRPFITVVVRTQGKRIELLRMALLSVANQKFSDFDVVVVGHSMDEKAVTDLKTMLAQLPLALSSKLSIEFVNGGLRSTPLNHSLKTFQGKYVTFLDDDDEVYPNWLDVFFGLYLAEPGKILRSQAVTQEFSGELIDGKFISKPESELSNPWSPQFSILDHILGNQSPFMTLAFPRILHDHYGMTFDESLSTTEDWDFLLRGAAFVGVANSLDITAVYKRWHGVSTSADIPTSEWEENAKAILGKLNSSPVLLPAGEVSKLYSLVSERTEDAQNAMEIHLVEKFRIQIEEERQKTRIQIEEERQRVANEAKLLKDAILAYHLETNHIFWRVTGPIRGLIDFLRRRRLSALGLPDFGSLESVSNATFLIANSVWWRIYKKIVSVIRLRRPRNIILK
jgi:glycosyltransferase involved in cell wall biosynthesis